MVYVHRPERDDHPDLAVVAVHQCTALGGSAVAAADISDSLCKQNILTISFDLRGAGESSGCCCMWPIPCATGLCESSDVVTVCRWVKETLGRDTWIAGVSAGGPVGGGAVDALDCIRGYTSVAYVLGLVTTILFLPQTVRLMCSPKPKLFILGNEDVFTSAMVFKMMMALTRRPRTPVLVPGAGHFGELGARYPIHLARSRPSHSGGCDAVVLPPPPSRRSRVRAPRQLGCAAHRSIHLDGRHAPCTPRRRRGASQQRELVALAYSIHLQLRATLHHLAPCRRPRL